MVVRFRAPRIGEIVAALGGLVVIASLFLAWVNVSISKTAFEGVLGDNLGGLTQLLPDSFGGTANAWEVFEKFDLTLLGLGIVAIGTVIAGLAGIAPGGSMPRNLGGLGVTVIVLVWLQRSRLGDRLPELSGLSLTFEVGFYVAMAAGVLLLVGAALCYRDDAAVASAASSWAPTQWEPAPEPHAVSAQAPTPMMAPPTPVGGPPPWSTDPL